MIELILFLVSLSSGTGISNPGISGVENDPVIIPMENKGIRPRQLLPEEGDVNLTCEYFRGSLNFRFAESEGNASVTVTLPDGALVKSATMITDK